MSFAGTSTERPPPDFFQLIPDALIFTAPWMGTPRPMSDTDPKVPSSAIATGF